jgi:hypothetical protein
MKESRNETLTAKEIAEAIPYPEGSQRPSEMTPNDCCYPDAPRPCPLVSCKFNNYLTPTDHGTIILTWPNLKPEEVPPDDSCLLDVIKRTKYSPENPMPYREMGRRLGVSAQGAKSMVDLAHKHAKESREEITGRKDDDA